MADQPVRSGHVIVVLLWAAGLLAVVNQYQATLAAGGHESHPPAATSHDPGTAHPAPH